MNTQPQRILVIEIKTIDNPGFDSSQLSTIKFFDTSAEYKVDLSYKQIGSAIIDAILRLGSNYRHPLLYDVQIIPGDGTDTSDPQLDKSPTRRRRRRRRKANSWFYGYNACS